MPCHMKSKYDEHGTPLGVVPCRGLVVSMIKSCRSPLNPELVRMVGELRARPDIDELKENALASWEFAPYHRLDEAPA